MFRGSHNGGFRTSHNIHKEQHTYMPLAALCCEMQCQILQPAAHQDQQQKDKPDSLEGLQGCEEEQEVLILQYQKQPYL